ncbi:MAG: hypothetical protein AAB038_05790 [Planctomycetota bacterium]
MEKKNRSIAKTGEAAAKSRLFRGLTAILVIFLLLLSSLTWAQDNSQTKTEYGSTVTISGPFTVPPNQSYDIILSAHTDAPIYQWALYQDGAFVVGSGFVFGHTLDIRRSFTQTEAGTHRYLLRFRGIAGAHGWPPYTEVFITVTIVPSDTTPPVIIINSPINGYTYTIADIIPISYIVYDNESGIMHENANLPLNESDVLNNAQINATTLRLGENSFVVLAMNGAGLFAEKTVKFRVSVTADAIHGVIDRLYADGQITNRGIYNSLTKQIEAVENSINRGQPQAAVNQMGAMANHIEAQSGKAIEQNAASLLLNYIRNFQVRTALPRETTLYLASEWASSPVLDPNVFAIHLADGSDVESILRGSMNVRIEATSDPDIASITVLNSDIVGTPITVNGVDFGTLYFTQDTANPSIGTLDLNNGYVDITVRQLLTSAYLTTPVSLETFYSGAIFPLSLTDLYIIGSGKIPDSTPQLGGSTYTPSSTLSSKRNETLPSDTWRVGPVSPTKIGALVITKTADSRVTIKIIGGGTITLTPVATASITKTGNAITITFFQAPSAGKNGTSISPSASAPPTNHYGKAVVIDVACAVSPSIVISNTQVITRIITTEYPDGTSVTPLPEVTPETNVVFPGPTHDVMTDFPGESISKGVDPSLANAVETITYTLRTEIWTIDHYGYWVRLGYWEWTYTLTIYHDAQGRVRDSTINLATKPRWVPAP